MNTMSYKNYTARIEFDGRDNIFVGRVLGLDSVLGYPRSLAYVLFSLKKENATWKVDEHKLVDARQIDSN